MNLDYLTPYYEPRDAVVDFIVKYGDGQCACPVVWGEYKPLPTRAVHPDPWRDIDAGVRATEMLLAEVSR